MERTIMDSAKSLLKNTKFRFICAGIINTAVDFIVFNIVLFVTHMRPEFASIISTTVAMCVSYFLNRRLVFKVEGKLLSRELPVFLLVTILSQWLVQALVINYMTGVISGFSRSVTFTGSGAPFLPDWVVVNAAKVLAVVAGAATNYLLYSRIVFAEKTWDWSRLWRKK